ncbi:TPA: acyl carrier protein [Candidatus Avacholeplasma faecigallinarum]|nr:acyl carrier protein [Candidatus Avacholeplasma faecigallinarum]
MEKLREILEGINPSIDYDKEKKLIDDHLLDSLNIIALIAEIEEEFDVTIPPKEIVSDNFNSLENLAYLINRLKLEK